MPAKVIFPDNVEKNLHLVNVDIFKMLDLWTYKMGYPKLGMPGSEQFGLKFLKIKAE